GSNQNNF
nr:Chain A, GSNQNNF [synthetic construct]6CLD_A Chain A, GSNQNNF [synthetic construct]6CLE_A Chain A, GSNQNNF [synthetic construct]6CLF_A Chain A, GSNQNNF [synthetic construct]6CLG_A Chain A, GSNQNNF [synthetic construct]6CLH_A Chain A, GSNQNNF [synthetic construct]6CLI_A Chain A, GSNQNNF [synthetic construct]6CLJ_A Chain A, GSNQNNF [synthetic construct]6CLK_A Chain A, GSNQNNF [synthetic construct]6CLL_A Chain A, GSNQNNF [synthetic construct]6CLM_A Chain A, GSNQNNF [synthetic construct]6